MIRGGGEHVGGWVYDVRGCLRSETCISYFVSSAPLTFEHGLRFCVHDVDEVKSSTRCLGAVWWLCDRWSLSLCGK